jgi:rRNA biogenesis protein RRP5
MPAKKRDREETTQAAAPSKKIKKAKDEADAIPKKSSLVREEVDFPRGGGTELTPLEYKNLRAEAVKEVQDELMFEVWRA